MKRDRTKVTARIPVMLTGVLPLVFLLAGCGGTDETTASAESAAVSERDRSSQGGTRDHRGDHHEGSGGHEEGDDRDHHEGDGDDDDEHEGDDDGTPTTRPDAGTTRLDAGSTRPDAGSTRPDAGSTRPDAGSTTPPPDAGTTRPDAGTPPPPPDAGTTRPDAGSTTPDAGPTSPPDAGTTPDAGAATCIEPVSAGSGHHNAGADCLSCHAGMSGANWTVAGTLYSAVSGGAAVAGATIELVDANGAILRLPTATNGNFYTTQRVAFPVHVRASKCPDDARMTGVAASGSCNSCHNSAFRVHLP